jgi:alpha-beta hydrolase superfamily lysophospholipase
VTLPSRRIRGGAVGVASPHVRAPCSRVTPVTRFMTAFLSVTLALAMAATAAAEETRIRVGAIDAVLASPSDVERPPIALLIAGSGSIDHDGNGPQIKPATLKKLAEQLGERKIATLRYDKRGAGGWKPEFGRPEDFRFKDYVDDAAALVGYLRSSGKFSKVILAGHSEGGLVAILTARRVPVDALVLLATAARRQGDLLKAQLEKKLAPISSRRSQRPSTPSWPDRSSIRRRRNWRSRRRCSPASPRPSPRTRSIR